MISKKYSLTAILVFISFTTAIAQSEMVSQKKVVNGSVLIYGETNIEQIFFDYPTWQRSYKYFRPDSATILKIADLLSKHPKIELQIFLGTWCPDSKREVPHFYKILDTFDLRDEFDITLWGVDRRKQMEGDLISDFKIRRVPTFVFLKDGKEFGRVTEYPDVSLEKDIHKELQKLK